MSGFSKKILFSLTIFVVIALAGSQALAAKEVRFTSVSWTGVTTKTELAVRILRSLGYEASSTMVSVPIAFKGLDTEEADVFLGNWMPTQATMANKYFDKGTIKKLSANMRGAKYTLAVPSYAYEEGLQNFEDISEYADKLDHKIYGIEEGNDGNQVIQSMIDEDMFDLGDFQLIPSSEAGMLSQVQSFIKDERWIVFLGWSPHHMNEMIDMKYLKGSTSETFGKNDGTATVYTLVRDGFAEENPNVKKFLENLVFPISMMNQIMTELNENDGLEPIDAGLDWVKDHPDVYKDWLEGVTTVSGEPALPAFEEYLETLE
ncbi:MAG: ABC transporter substrate-binding protein [Thermodesulfobacteriota bacterium]